MHAHTLFSGQQRWFMKSGDETHQLVALRIAKQTDRTADGLIDPLLEEIKQKHGDSLLAILVYGSWLRGKRDTMLDFYVLVENYQALDSAWQGWMCKLLPPNVYQIHLNTENGELRAKYALLTLDRFQYAMRHDFHSYFWARFAQPCDVIYARDEPVLKALTSTFSQAASKFVNEVLPVLPERFSSRQLWTRGLSLTYQCELRTESSNRAESLYDFDPGYYAAMTLALAHDTNALATTLNEDMYCNRSSVLTMKLSGLKWWLRRVHGKVLSVLRLIKAAFTFNDSLQYLLWKIERHSGLYIKPSARQLKHPLIFAWPLLWRLYRQGAFR